jgi:hypothetical protein
MDRLSAPTALALVISVLFAAHQADAAEGSEPEYALGQSVPLDDEDLKNITLQVMQKQPLVSSSSGIKYASAQRSVRSMDIANVLYFPHVERSGVKQAFLARCVRQLPGKQWLCEDPEIRAYIKLESQDFEVRVSARITLQEALALIEATRTTVQQSRSMGAAIPRTAIQILHADSSYSSYLVDWGNEEGQHELTIEARLRSGGDAAEAEGWQTSVWEPSEWQPAR